MSSKNIEELLGTTIDEIRKSVDTEAVIGQAITTEDGTIVIPVSKVAYGFASGGSDFPVKNPNAKETFGFGGGGGAGVSVTPVGFLVIAGNNIRMIQIEPYNNSIDRIIEATPVIIDKISEKIKEFSAKRAEKKKAKEEADKEAKEAETKEANQ